MSYNWPLMHSQINRSTAWNQNSSAGGLHGPKSGRSMFVNADTLGLPGFKLKTLSDLKSFGFFFGQNRRSFLQKSRGMIVLWFEE